MEGAGKKAGRRMEEGRKEERKEGGRREGKKKEEREGRKVKGELSLREYWESIGKCRRYD